MLVILVIAGVWVVVAAGVAVLCTAARRADEEIARQPRPRRASVDELRPAASRVTRGVR